MTDDIVMHLSSNSSPSLPSKLAKLEARMAGKSSSSPAIQSSSWQAVQSVTATAKFAPSDKLPVSSSDSDDDNGREFLIQHNIQKRQKVQVDDQVMLQSHEGTTDGRTKVADAGDVRRSLDDSNKKRQGRGRGHSATGRGRSSKASDQMRSLVSSSTSLSNGHHESLLPKENWSKVQLGNDERASLQEEILSLRGKIASLEEDLSKSRQETTDHQQRSSQLEKELKDLKEHDKRMKTKRLKVLSDLLISMSKAERQEARTKVRQESLRLGNVSVIRAGTIISETWEDGQTLKDINAHLKSLLETKEAIERHRKSLKKRQSDKGDGSDVEAGISEEDFLIQDEICKSRLASIKRVHLFVLYLVVIAFTEVDICMQFEAVGTLFP